MKIELKILIIISTIHFACNGQTNTDLENQEFPSKSYKIDSSIIAILPFDTVQFKAYKDIKPTDLTFDDLLKIEKILHKCINDYNPEQERKFKEFNDQHPDYKIDKNRFIIDLSRYVRQYVATINSEGEKEVWVNCLCSTSGEWRNHLIFVMDGGNCFFSLKINLTTGQYYQFSVNGDA